MKVPAPDFPLDASIRPLHTDDLPALLALNQHLHTNDVPLPSPEMTQQTWQAMLAQPGMVCLGGFAGGQLVASCTLVVVPNLTRGCRPYALIENVVTHAGHRQQGWGRRLLRAALDRAWALGCYKAMLFTGRAGDAVFRFYEGAGFSRHGKQAFIARPQDQI